MGYPNLAPKLRNLRLLIIDIDGVLTGGGIIYDTAGQEQKVFDVKDGLGIVMLGGLGIQTAVITGRESDVVARRAAELKIDHLLQGYPIKLPAYEKLKKATGLKDESIGFVGDDLIDLDVMRHVGFAAAPADAHPAVKRIAHYVCKRRGGQGAVREVVDLILAFRLGEFGPINYIPPVILEHWQDRVWEKERDEEE